jgi:hypothetical protein
VVLVRRFGGCDSIIGDSEVFLPGCKGGSESMDGKYSTADWRGGPPTPSLFWSSFPFYYSGDSKNTSLYVQKGNFNDRHEDTRKQVEEYFNIQILDFIKAIKTPVASDDF